ncbi:CopG family transcriptional regulator [Alicyclobacillus fastidiosus]|uniref:CopG family transcriptional regulator n=1 Tax=Alicyclobacillus fastidiosus TaxID=392011 RepID=A0ABV5A9V6_9BACL|nr:CopG family transcriptional regulator [Alicyclobacillus fastidiosus]WEH10949.1 CopG family transcriptional regulator [Alicyclobacillus fastidiosus]
MATEMKRFMVSIPRELEQKLMILKQRRFFGVSWSEMSRELIEIGADKLIGENNPQPASESNRPG